MLLSKEPISADSAIPRYTLYGETAEGKESWFLNIEHLAERCRERGWQIDPHSHPQFGQIMLVRSGRGTVTFEDKHLEFDSPCVMVIPLRCVHGFHYERDTDGWVITIAEYYLQQINGRLPEFVQLWSAPRLYSLERGGSAMEELRNLIVKLERELETKEVGHLVAAEAQVISLFLQLLRSAQSEAVEQPQQTSSQTRVVESFRALVEKQYRESWKIGDFAAAVGVSESQLRAACENIEGQSPVKILHRRKLIEANRNLLFSEMTIEQIAYWLGFSSPAYFTRFYKKEEGITPAQFRQRNRHKGAG